MPIDTTHPSYDAIVDDWEKIEDVTRKKDITDYLVKLNPSDLSAENTTRNNQYKERAVFYSISGHTAQGLVGSVFRKWPTVNLPDTMRYLLTNADGAGVSIYQQSQAVCDDVIRKGRAGLMVSFPQTEGQVSQADIVDGRVVATIHRLEPEQIINWRTTRDGSNVKLSLVAIMEESEEPDPDDPYILEPTEKVRELFLDEAGDYNERVWKKVNDKWEAGDPYIPVDAKGNKWRQIPFTFIGSENNDTEIDPPPLLPIVDLNVGHYRNSADYEDSIWYCGQVQPWMSGVTQDHIDMMNKNNMYVGSRNLLGVPDGEQFGFAQANPNPAVRQAMEDKVNMMISLGARLMSTGSATKTATQVAGEREAQTSLLSLVASNVSEAYTQAIEWVGRYLGIEDDDAAYTLNQEFLAITADAQMAQAVMRGFIEGTVPLPDYVRYMKRVDLFDDERTLEDYADYLPFGNIE